MLVTGGSGFVGSALVPQLVGRGHDVSVFDRSEPADVVGDVRDRTAVERAIADSRADVVIHLAAMHFIPECEADPGECEDVNVGGTAAVLDAAAAAGTVRRVVFASTAAVYAPSDRPHHEGSPLGPTDTYGRAKLEGERLAAQLHAQGGGPAVAVARLFNVFGPGETNPHLIPAILEQVGTGDDLTLGNLDTRRDYVFVEDVAEALAAFAELPPAEDLLVCNVGAERDVDGHTLVKTIGRLAGRDLVVRTDPARLRPSDRPRLASDCAHIRAVTGWFARTSLEEGLHAAMARPLAARLA